MKSPYSYRKTGGILGKKYEILYEDTHICELRCDEHYVEKFIKAMNAAWQRGWDDHALEHAKPKEKWSCCEYLICTEDESKRCEVWPNCRLGYYVRPEDAEDDKRKG